MLKRKVIGVTLLATMFVVTSVAAQRNFVLEKRKDRLEQLSKELKEQARIERKHAHELARRKGLPVRSESANGGVIELQRISPDGRPVYYITNNISAADTVSTDEIWPGGSAGLNLSGSGFTVGEWDAGAIADHFEFTGRLTQVDMADIIAKAAPGPVLLSPATIPPMLPAPWPLQALALRPKEWRMTPICMPTTGTLIHPK